MNHRAETTLSHEYEQAPTLREKASQLIKMAAAEGGYKHLRNAEKLPHQEALQKAAESAAAHHEALEMSEADASFVDLLGRVGGFIEAQHTLHMNQQKDWHELSHTERKEAKRLKLEKVIPFNHSLKEFINHHPSQTVKELSTALTATYTGAFKPYGSYEYDLSGRETLSSFEGIIDGMRHEIAAETLLDSVDIDYRYELSDEDDSKGRDLYVKYGDDWHAIDIKSTLPAENRSRQNYPENPAAWTGLEYADFKGPKGTTPGALTIPYPDSLEPGYAFLDRIEAGLRSAYAAQERRYSRA